MIRQRLQWLPTAGWAEQLDPRTKLLLALFVLIILFTVGPMGIIPLFWWALLALSTTKEQVTVIGAFRAVLLLAFFAVVTYAWWGPPPFVFFGWLRLSRTGLTRGMLTAGRLFVMALTASALARSTTPLSLSDALRWLLTPFERLGISVPDLPMLLAIGTRFLPELQADARRLYTLLRLRNTGRHGTHKRFSASYLSQIGKEVLAPLVRISLQRASVLGEALALRGYAPGRRPGLPPYRISGPDLVAWSFTLVVVAVAWLV